MKRFVIDMGPAPDFADVECSYQLDIDGQMYTGIRVAILDEVTGPKDVNARAPKAVLKQLTSARLSSIREQAISALEAGIRDVPSSLHSAMTRVIESVLAAEVACIKWRV
jgi:hypothetical protein